MNNLVPFPDMVRSLAKPGAEILEGLTPEMLHRLHMAVGVSGEVAELAEAIIIGDKPGVVEEVGDLEFYLEGYRQGCYLVRRPPGPQAESMNYPYHTINALVIHAGNLLDLTKKEFIYRKPLLINELFPPLEAIDNWLVDIYTRYEFTREYALEQNQHKLGKRYPGLVYTDQAAQDRVDKV